MSSQLTLRPRFFALISLVVAATIMPSITWCKNIDAAAASARLYSYAYTSTVQESKVITAYVPSSCVQVDATLTPCRNVRFLKFPTLAAAFPSYDKQLVRTDSPIHTTALGWAEYLGLYAPTVTVTHTNIHTSTVQDAGIVVTFAVKGCRPLKLPLDLDRCVDQTTATSVRIEDNLATWTVAAPPRIEPTATLVTSTVAMRTASPDINDHQIVDEANYDLGGEGAGGLLAAPESHQILVESSTAGDGDLDGVMVMGNSGDATEPLNIMR